MQRSEGRGGWGRMVLIGLLALGLALALAWPSRALEATPNPIPGNVVWAWGYNPDGQLGNGTAGGNSNVPVQVSNLSDAIAIAGETYDGLALKGDGTVWAWGDNQEGGLGNGTTGGSSTVPVQVSNLSDAIAIAGETYDGLALKGDGTVWAWGDNQEGELGNGTTGGSSDVPVQVSNLTDITAIAGEGGSGLALKSDGTVWAWGDNLNGQLGNNSTSSSDVPVQVSNLTDVIAIAGETYNGLALKSDGTVWAWGYNQEGELGNGTTGGASTVPVQVSNLSDVTAIAGEGYNGLALKSDGTVWAWGYNLNGSLGDNSTNSSDVPVQVSNLTGITGIAGKWEDGLALKSDGTVWAWGDNIYGELGNGTTGRASIVPVQVSNLTGVTGIAAELGDGLALIPAPPTNTPTATPTATDTPTATATATATASPTAVVYRTFLPYVAPLPPNVTPPPFPLHRRR